jgi:hypothetical protein
VPWPDVARELVWLALSMMVKMGCVPCVAVCEDA